VCPGATRSAPGLRRFRVQTARHRFRGSVAVDLQTISFPVDVRPSAPAGLQNAPGCTPCWTAGVVGFFVVGFGFAVVGLGFAAVDFGFAVVGPGVGFEVGLAVVGCGVGPSVVRVGTGVELVGTEVVAESSNLSAVLLAGVGDSTASVPPRSVPAARLLDVGVPSSPPNAPMTAVPPQQRSTNAITPPTTAATALFFLFLATGGVSSTRVDHR